VKRKRNGAINCAPALFTRKSRLHHEPPAFFRSNSVLALAAHGGRAFSFCKNVARIANNAAPRLLHLLTAARLAKNEIALSRSPLQRPV
jgi:hypothetical protein